MRETKMKPVGVVIVQWTLILMVLIVSVLFVLYAAFGAPKNTIRDGETHFVKSARSVTPIPVGVTPHGLALYKNLLYVANNNNYGITGSDSVTVFDTKQHKLKTTITDTSFEEPYTITIDGFNAYVTNSNGSTISVIDLKTNTVSAVIDGFDGPSGLTIPKGSRVAYINNYGGPNGVQSGNGTTVQRLDLDTQQLLGSPLTVGLAPAAIVASPDGRFVYTINYTVGLPGSGTMSRIEVETNTAIVNFVSGLFGPFEFVIDNCGKYAYVTNSGSNNFSPYGTTVSVVDLSV